MKYQLHFLSSLVLLFILVECCLTTSYHPDISWKNTDSLMSGDLRHRMSKKIPTRRRYCGCAQVEDEDKYPVCASNKALYENACLFRCAKVRWPHLSEVDIADCGTHTFKEFKQSEFRPHY